MDEVSLQESQSSLTVHSSSAVKARSVCVFVKAGKGGARYLGAGISVVTTCYNERETLRQTPPNIRTVLAAVPHEIIVFDDSSPDGSVRVAKELADAALSRAWPSYLTALAISQRCVYSDPREV